MASGEELPGVDRQPVGNGPQDQGLDTKLAALSGVREAVWKMQSVDDLDRLLGVVKEALDAMGVSYLHCGINLLEEGERQDTVRSQVLGGGSDWKIAGEAWGGSIVWRIWKKGVPAYRPDLEREDVYGEKAQIEAVFETPIRSVIDLPFSHGTLALNHSRPEAFDPEDIAFLRELSEVLSEGFSRLEDFRRLSRANEELRREIAERQRAEARLERLRDDLQRHVAELERSNRELDEFAYIASHDLKAPLRGLENLARLIDQETRQTLPPDKRRLLDLLRGRVRRMDQLLADLLRYARIGRQDDDAVEVDVGVLVEEVAALLDIPPAFCVECRGLPVVKAPETPLKQVFTNLIGNAVKHHDGEAGCIEVVGRDLGAVWEFCVTDDGPGIPAAFRAKALGLFQTLRPRDEVEGSGVGLAIVKKIIENQRGTLSLEAAQPRGARFRFTWPKAV